MNNSFTDIATGEKIDYLDESSLRPIQLDALKKTLIHAQNNSGFYKQLLNKINFSSEDFSSLEELKSIPFTTKELLQKHNNEFLTVPVSEVAEYVTTSGTLGSPVKFLLTDNDLKRLSYNEARGLSIAGVISSDIVQITTTLDKRFMAGLAYYFGSRLIGAGTVRVGVGAPQLQWDTINQMSPTVLIGVPSFIVKLIEFALDHKIDISNSSVRKIICIGEPIRDIHFDLNKVGHFIHDHWDVELYSTYASTEMATAFTECSEGKGGHQLNELIYIEIIDEEGLEVKPGDVGELVITTLKVEGMPLIRFRTGDMVRKETNTCSCGRTSHRLSPIVGRKGQLIKYKGTSLYPSSLQHILDHMTEVDTYIIEAVLNDYDEDQINVLIAIKGDNTDTLSKLKEMCIAQIRVTPEFMIRDASFINHLRNRPDMRKPILFIDNRNKG